MQPGYRKKSSFSTFNRDSTGFVNMNDVVGAIKDMMGSDEFYEIEPAVVLKCYTDDTDPDFPTRTNVGNELVPDYSYLGAVAVRLLFSQSDNEVVEKLIRPISKHLVQYPLKGEIVNIANYNGQLYYSNPLNLNNLVNMNKLTTNFSDNIVLHKYTKFYRPVATEQGDTVIQGRFGQSIHFGSDRNFVKPFVKIVAGQGLQSSNMKPKVIDSSYPHVENINLDEASIYLTTNQHVPLRTNAPSKMKSARLGGAGKSAIVMNADAVAINAKNEGENAGDVSLYAQRNINLASNTSINLESEYGKIYLGDVDSMNPLVKGKELELFLKTFVKSIVDFGESFLEADDYLDKELSLSNLIDSMNGLLQDLNRKDTESIFSKKVFITNDHNPPDVRREGSANQIPNEDDLDLDSLWSDVKWEQEIVDVTSEGYDVESINTTATGVRG